MTPSLNRASGDHRTGPELAWLPTSWPVGVFSFFSISLIRVDLRRGSSWSLASLIALRLLFSFFSSSLSGSSCQSTPHSPLPFSSRRLFGLSTLAAGSEVVLCVFVCVRISPLFISPIDRFRISFSDHLRLGEGTFFSIQIGGLEDDRVPGSETWLTTVDQDL